MSTNLYKILRDLIPQSPLLIGEVKSISGGVATIDIRGGGVGKARCSDTIKPSDNVFFRDGVIEAKTPNLPLSVIEI